MTDDVVVHRAPVEGSITGELDADARALVLAAFGTTPAELGEEPPAIFERRLRYPTRAVRSVDREDARVDSSLLGLSWPFRAVEPGSTRMQATLAAVQRELQLPDGGVLRHQGNDYAGGNAWLLTTLWLGLAQRQAGDEAGLGRTIEYTLARQTSLGLLPEQVTRTGEPAWVVPLGWSHAMLVLAARPELALVRDSAAAPA